MTDRRSFLRSAGSATVAAPFFIRELLSKPPSGTVRLAGSQPPIASVLRLSGLADLDGMELIGAGV